MGPVGKRGGVWKLPLPREGPPQISAARVTGKVHGVATPRQVALRCPVGPPGPGPRRTRLRLERLLGEVLVDLSRLHPVQAQQVPELTQAREVRLVALHRHHDAHGAPDDVPGHAVDEEVAVDVFAVTLVQVLLQRDLLLRAPRHAVHALPARPGLLGLLREKRHPWRHVARKSHMPKGRHRLQHIQGD